MGFSTQRFLGCFALLLALATTGSAATGAASSSALMVSDLHFNPFHDPAKVKRLAAAPAGKWEAILASPDTPKQSQDFEALSRACELRGADTPYALLASALRQIRRNAKGAAFITVSGDLLAHRFDCMFAKTVPGATPEKYTEFTAKTIEYEVLQLRNAVPGARLYLALGNNDSGCGDYRLDTGARWFALLAKVAKAGVGSTWNDAATRSFDVGGYYSVEMALPMQRTRLIVVNDTFLAQGFHSCAGERDWEPGKKQMLWLQNQLDRAREHHERVWIMGHIPPGVSAAATMRQQLKHRNLCTAAGEPVSFLADHELGDTMRRNADVIKLGIFGHMHVDELRLLSGKSGEIPIKVIASITPIGGNYPSFTIAKINPQQAQMTDFTVFAASDPNGSSWEKEYTFSGWTSGSRFSVQALQKAIAAMAADPKATSSLSQGYILHWSAGAHRDLLQPVWPAYVCGMSHSGVAAFRNCVCDSSLGQILQ